MNGEREARIERAEGRPMALPPGAALDNESIFRQLILDEIRNGRLTPSRRRRVIRYAAKLNLTAVQAGRLVASCRDEVLQDETDPGRVHAMRLVEPPPTRTPAATRLLGVAMVAIVANLLLYLCFR